MLSKKSNHCVSVCNMRLLIYFWIMSLFSVVSFAVELPDFTALVEKASPAVVKIQIETSQNRPQAFMGAPRAKGIPEPMALGSGFIVEADGYILTNHHVIRDADRIIVRLNDRREFDAEVIGSDERSDIALLKIDASNLPTLDLAANDTLKVGEWVLAIGSPFGLDYSVSQGIVSAIGRSLPNGENENYVPFIQTDVAINPGNSGGPLFNLAGDVVGINSQIFTRSGGSMGLSFAIPASVVRSVVKQLKESGYVSRGWLGVAIQEVDRQLAQSFGLSKPEGALVAQVNPAGPAAQAGVMEGDVITRFAGKPILYSGDLPHLVGLVTPNSKVDMTVMRHGHPQVISVVVGELADKQARVTNRYARKAQRSSVKGVLGMQLDTLDRLQITQLHIAGGVRIRAIQQGGAAEKAGLRVGDIVVQLGFTDVTSPESFQQIVKDMEVGSIQPIRFFRDGQPIFRSIVIQP